jgi:hypothetical protein
MIALKSIQGVQEYMILCKNYVTHSVINIELQQNFNAL